MRILILGLTTLILLFSACAKKPMSTVVPADEASALSPKGLVYSLPKTSLKVKVEAQFTSFVPGPYARFAQKYLGLSGISTSPSSTWAITKVNVETKNHADLQTLFVVEPEESFDISFLKISNEGLVIPISSTGYALSKQQYQPQPQVISELEFVDLSNTPFIAAEQTTHYTRVLQDSSFVRVPVHKSMVVEKSLEEKAKEAADFIFSLRKRRFELLSGDADFVAEGKAAEAVLREISRLESEYLTLFTGKAQTSTATYWFDYSPDGQKKDASAILFRFSESRGILPLSDLSGSPVLVSVVAPEQWSGVEIFDRLNADEKGMPRLDAIYYRIPVPVSVRIHDSKTDFFSQSLTFFQFGPIIRMPSKYLNSFKN